MSEKKQKRLLILGGTPYVIPIIHAAHRLGYYAITCDYLPDNIAHKYSDEYCNVSIVDKEAVCEAARRLKVDGIISFATDPGVDPAAYACEQLGLPCSGPYESIHILQNKGLFRKFLIDNGFNAPAAKGYHSVDEALAEAKDYFHWPVIVKPTDSAGSKGVSRVDRFEDLKEKIEFALKFSIGKEFIIEDFIVPKVCSDTDSFSVDGELKFVSFNNQLFDKNAANPYTPAGYIYPSDMSDATKKELTSELQRLMTLLKMRTLIYNIETREGADGKGYIMEVSPRGGGNRLAELLTLSTGVDLITNAVRAAVGEPVEEIEQKGCDGFWTLVVLHCNESGVFERLDVDEKIRDNVKDVRFFVNPGDLVKGFNAANEAVGHAFLRFDTREEADEVMDAPEKYLRVVLK